MNAPFPPEVQDAEIYKECVCGEKGIPVMPSSPGYFTVSYNRPSGKAGMRERTLELGLNALREAQRIHAEKMRCKVKLLSSL